MIITTVETFDYKSIIYLIIYKCDSSIYVSKWPEDDGKNPRKFIPKILNRKFFFKN